MNIATIAETPWYQRELDVIQRMSPSHLSVKRIMGRIAESDFAGAAQIAEQTFSARPNEQERDSSSLLSQWCIRVASFAHTVEILLAYKGPWPPPVPEVAAAIGEEA